jgi:LPXTG-motif cell wall-anchored protein
MAVPPPEKPGLQAERTQLSWERSAFSFLIVGALSLLGQGPLDAGQTVLPVVGAALAMLAVWLGRRRARRMTAAPRAEVVLLGWATAGFAAVIVVVGAF